MLRAARQGLEPQLSVPETGVLPLDERARCVSLISLASHYTARKSIRFKLLYVLLLHDPRTFLIVGFNIKPDRDDAGVWCDQNSSQS
jgi:hypothetical protein